MPIPKQANPEDLENDDLDHEEQDDAGTGDNDDSAPAPAGDKDDGSVVVELEEGEEENDENNTVVEEEDEEDEERKRIREARRQERQERKQRAREREERIQRELAQEREARRQLEQRLATIERKNSGAEVAQLDNVIKQTKDAHDYFKEQIAEATKKNDGATVAEATEKMILARERLNQLNRVKQAVEQRERTPAPLDERLVSNAQKFMSKHTWYKPEGQDNDSTVMRTLDNAVAAEGWDPTTPQYWQELENRVKKYLPHRVKGAKVTTVDTGAASDDDDDEAPVQRTTRTKPKSPVAGSGQGAGASSGKATFTLSAERVKAMKEAGMWDDPALRQKQIKAYRDYDKANKGGK